MEKLKSLVVFYSFEGNTRFIAQTIAAEIGGELLELKPKKEIQTHGFMKYVWGGRQAMMKEKPELLPYQFDPDEFENIFIGTPVWAFTFAPPVNTFLANHTLKDKKIALFCCNEGGLGKTFEHFANSLAGNQIIGQMAFYAPLKKGKESTEIAAREWARKMMQINEA